MILCELSDEEGDECSRGRLRSLAGREGGMQLDLSHVPVGEDPHEQPFRDFLLYAPIVIETSPNPAAASPTSLKVTTRRPFTVTATHLHVQSRFRSIPGASFDGAFIRHEVGDYRYFLQHFEEAASRGSPLIRQYATSEIVNLEEDQAKIMSVAAEVG